MGIMLDGKYFGVAGDVAYVYINELIKGYFTITARLDNGCYRGYLLNAILSDFAYEFMVTPEQIKPIITGINAHP